jgi:hypothetical protein
MRNPRTQPKSLIDRSNDVGKLAATRDNNQPKPLGNIRKLGTQRPQNCNVSS